ncbi:MAG: hypothetical protein KA715_07520 [Xanthomonadaceae bacterium]|nr:hypothetical protein [Xanthomonadaceae bacterium]
MGQPKTVRFDDELEKKVEEYLETNGIKFTQLMKMAVTKFISEPQSIHLAPVDTKDFVASSKKHSKNTKKL